MDICHCVPVDGCTELVLCGLSFCDAAESNKFLPLCVCVCVCVCVCTCVRAQNSRSMWINVTVYKLL